MIDEDRDQLTAILKGTMLRRNTGNPHSTPKYRCYFNFHGLPAELQLTMSGVRSPKITNYPTLAATFRDPARTMGGSNNLEERRSVCFVLNDANWRKEKQSSTAPCGLSENEVG